MFNAQLDRLSSPSHISICLNKSQEFRFLHATVDQRSPFKGISSTKIHEYISELKGENLRTKLEGTTLSPKLCWQLLNPTHCKKIKFRVKDDIEVHTEMPSCRDNSSDLGKTKRNSESYVIEHIHRRVQGGKSMPRDYEGFVVALRKQVKCEGVGRVGRL